MAGQIRKHGKYMAADFIGDRFYSQNMRIVGAIVAILISIAYCVGQYGWLDKFDKESEEMIYKMIHGAYNYDNNIYKNLISNKLPVKELRIYY